MTVFKKRCLDNCENKALIAKLSRDLGINEITATLLINRGVVDLKSAKNFLNPSISQMYDPFLLKDMNIAVNIIKESLANGDRITVFGDYDVDGVTSSTILKLFFKNYYNVDIDIYIPNRFEEGYGLNLNAIKKIYDKDTDLIITVDCGIKSFEQVELANSLGMNIIITDHHQCDDTLPEAAAVINPCRTDNKYPFSRLAGVGVASKLIQALSSTDEVLKYIDVIALGTIADIVPLKDENRFLVTEGLNKINNDPSIGIASLIDIAGLKKKEIQSHDVAFGLAPRINASGRMKSAKYALQLLTSSDKGEADFFASKIDKLNQERKKTEQTIIDIAIGLVKEQHNLCKDKILIISAEGLNDGVIGIAASKLVELYNRPCAIISISNGIGKGSARGIDGVDLYELLNKCSDIFLGLGGHEQAAGFSIKQDRIDELRERLLDYASESIDDKLIIKSCSYEMEIKETQIDKKLLEELNKFCPYGAGNPKPLFLIKDIGLKNARCVGNKDKHLKLFLDSENIKDAIGFGLGNQIDYIGSKTDFIAAPSINEYMGKESIQYVVKAIRPQYDPNYVNNILKSFYDKFYKFVTMLMDYEYDICRFDNMKYSTLNYEDAISNIEKNSLGVLLLVNTYESAYKLLNQLKDNNMLRNIHISYGYPQEAYLGRNAVTLIPDMDNISFKHYNEVYLIEDNFIVGNRKLLKTIKPVTRAKYKSKEYKSIICKRKDFENIYKFLMIQKKSIWKDYEQLTDCVNSNCNIDYNRFIVQLSLNVFNELNFLVLKNNKQNITVELCKNIQKRSLNESKLYQTYIRLVENITTN